MWPTFFAQLAGQYHAKELRGSAGPLYTDGRLSGRTSAHAERLAGAACNGLAQMSACGEAGRGSWQRTKRRGS
jgi:hypothetical protein